jgi:hypothetical protein
MGYSQCEVDLKTSHKSENGKGTIELRVKASDSYVIELLSYKGIERSTIQTKTGSGNGKFTFKDLATNRSYQVSVSFPLQTEFLCRKKFTEEIFFEIN